MSGPWLLHQGMRIPDLSSSQYSDYFAAPDHFEMLQGKMTFCREGPAIVLVTPYAWLIEGNVPMVACWLSTPCARMPDVFEK